MAGAVAASPAQGRLAQAQPGPQPLQGALLWFAAFILAMSNFMAVLDTSVANVSIPNIAGGLAVSPNQGTWVITSYSVAEAITVPLTGWLAQRFGAVRTYLICIGLFGLASALCGLSHSLTVLVFFRVCQGLAGGPMMPLSQTLLLRIFPPKMAPQAIGLWAMTTVVGPIAGPLLGGWLSDQYGWPWVFFINVPVAILLVVVGMQLMAGRETQILKLKVDTVGLSLLIVWVSALQIMLDKGKELDWFNSPIIIALLIVAVLGFICFMIWELTDKQPIVDLKVFRYPGFAVSAAIMPLVFGSFFASVVLVPLWLQTNMGYTAQEAGRLTAFNGVLAVVMSPVVAQLTRKVDPRLLISFGVALLGATMFWRTTFNSTITFQQMVWPSLAQGFAMPFFFVPLMGLALGSVKPSETASAAGLISFARTVAGAFGTSIVTTSWENSSTRVRADMVGQLNQAPRAVDTIAASGFSHGAALSQLDNLVQSQAVMVATNHTFQTIGAVMMVAAATVWLAPKPKGAAPPPGAGGH
jgi:DHA2 family multidrug resistance protein